LLKEEGRTSPRSHFPPHRPILQKAQQALRGPWLLPFPAA
jgi:hypothetical protein